MSKFAWDPLMDQRRLERYDSDGTWAAIHDTSTGKTYTGITHEHAEKAMPKHVRARLHQAADEGREGGFKFGEVNKAGVFKDHG